MRLTFIVLFGFLCLSCKEKEPSEKYLYPSVKYEYLDLDPESLVYREEVYVPVYSDIYLISGERRLLLTVTLSVRNTSRKEPVFIQTVDYYDSEGVLHRNYLKQPIRLAPLQSVEFVIEDSEKKGGAGANFLVQWGAKKMDHHPVIQAVMIGASSMQGVSYLTEGVVIERWVDTSKAGQ